MGWITRILTSGLILLGIRGIYSQELHYDNKSIDYSTSTNFQRATVFIDGFSAYVTHMEPDLHIDGNILYTTGSGVVLTTDGITSTIIAGNSGYGWVTGFRQISSTRVVIADSGNSCLRHLDRLSLETSQYAGMCGQRGYEEGFTNARFQSPHSVIHDVKLADTLIVSDAGNCALRHVYTYIDMGIPSPVANLMESSDRSFRPLGMTQDISGDIYLTSKYQHAIFQLIYSSKTLSVLAGSTTIGYVDSDFSGSRFAEPQEILVIDHGRKLLVAGFMDGMVRVLDLVTMETTSLCSGDFGQTYSNTSTCPLQEPSSLMVLNKTLYVGGSGSIQKIKDQMPLRRLVFRAHYDLECQTSEGNITALEIVVLMARHSFTYTDICGSVCSADCGVSDEVDVQLTCSNHTLTVVWPTDVVYTRDIIDIPTGLKERLTSRIIAKGQAFPLFISGNFPPVVFPDLDSNGGSVRALLSSSCEGDDDVTYNEESDSCEMIPYGI